MPPPIQKNHKPALTSKQAADLLGVTMYTVHRWVERGLLDAWKTPGGHRRVTQLSVDKLLQQRDEALEKKNGANPISVLVVEEDDVLLKVYKSKLRSWGYSLGLATAKGGVEELIQAVKKKPNFLIADLLMPDLDGFHMIRQIRGDPDLSDI